MKKNLLRLSLSLALSLAFAIATHLWYRRYERSLGLVSHVNETPVAQVNEVGAGVERKAKKRLIWQGLERADALFSGEEVRTPEMASAELFFVESGAKIEVEPGSLITIEKSMDGPQIDLISGHLFVEDLEPENKTPLLVKADGKVVSRDKGNVTISKPKGGPVEVDAPNSGQGNSGDPKRLSVVRPRSHAILYIDEARPEKMQIELAKELQPEQEIVVLMGTARDRLVPVPSELQGKVISTSTRKGDVYWRVQVKDKAQGQVLAESRVSRVKFVAKIAPVNLRPAGNAQIVVHNPEDKVRFEWANAGSLRQQLLEIADSPDLKKNRRTISVGDRNWVSTSLPLGEYYWRVNGYLANGGALASRVTSVSVVGPTQLKAQPEPTLPVSAKVEAPSSSQLVASESEGEPAREIPRQEQTETPIPVSTPLPELRTPQMKTSVSFKGTREANRKGQYFLEWQPVDGADQYEIEITDQRGRTVKQTDKPQIQFEKLAPGVANVQVSALRQTGERSPASEKIQIQVPQVSDAKAPKLKSVQVHEDDE